MMKTFADFIAEAKKSKSDYSKSYAAKVSAVRDRQHNFVKAQKDRTQQQLQRRQEAENRKKEEEKENPVDSDIRKLLEDELLCEKMTLPCVDNVMTSNYQGFCKGVDKGNHC